jgi:hypothetical protein
MIFQEWLCDCEHTAYEHDDGFGCTALDCWCLAGWELER